MGKYNLFGITHRDAGSGHETKGAASTHSGQKEQLGRNLTSRELKDLDRGAVVVVKYGGKESAVRKVL